MVVPSLRGEFHRYVIPLAAHMGHRVSEIPITHRPRLAGRAKYANPSRLATGLTDLIALRMLLLFQDKPMQLFGIGGGLLILSSTLMRLYLVFMKFVRGYPLTPRLPSLVLTVLLFVAGLQMLLWGFIAEMIASLREGRSREKSEEATCYMKESK